eukprot:gene47767-34084_t
MRRVLPALIAAALRPAPAVAQLPPGWEVVGDGQCVDAESNTFQHCRYEFDGSVSVAIAAPGETSRVDLCAASCAETPPCGA